MDSNLYENHLKSVADCQLSYYFSWYIYKLIQIMVLQMLELVVKYRQSDEMLRCVEFIRILLADNISSWHSAYRTRRNPALPPARVTPPPCPP